MLRVNTPTVVHDFIEDEVVIVNLERGLYYSLSGLSALVWKAIDKGASVDLIESALIELNITNVTGDSLSAFIKDLLEDGLVSNDEAAVGSVSADDLQDFFTGCTEFELKLNRYSDMQEFLLLDPIHDVGDMGWPNTK